MMSFFCYLCDTNLPCKDYTGTKLLSENGEKPCMECLLEAGVFDDEEAEEDQ